MPRVADRVGLRRGRTIFLAVGDLAALTVAYLATYAAANQIAPPAVDAPGWLLALLACLAVPFWVALFTAYHLYDNDHQRISVASFDEVGAIFHALLAGSLVFLLLAQATRRLFDWWIYSAIEASLFLTASIVLIPLVRGTLRSWVLPRVMQRRRALIVGAGEEAALVHRKLLAHPEYGLDLVGFLDGEGPVSETTRPVLGRTEDVARIVDELEIDRILLASSIASHEDMLDLIRTVRRPDVQVSIVPRYFEIFTSHAILDDVEGMPVVTLPSMRLGRSSRLLKRAFDIAVVRPRARAALAGAPGDRDRDPARQRRPGRSTGSRAAAARARRSASSSSGRCSSAPSSAAPRSCT